MYLLLLKPFHEYYQCYYTIQYKIPAHNAKISTFGTQDINCKNPGINEIYGYACKVCMPYNGIKSSFYFKPNCVQHNLIMLFTNMILTAHQIVI